MKKDFIEHRTHLPSFLLSNVRALANKLDDLQNMASVLNIDVIALTETWLHDAIDDSHISISNYSAPFRRDRQGRLGGGVCCYVRHGISTSAMHNLPAEPPCIECLWIRFPREEVISAVAYIPPSLSRVQYDEITAYFIRCADLALNEFMNYRLIFLGDFNRMPVDEITDNLNLVQIVELPIRGSVILDKIFMDTELKELYHQVIIGPSVGSSDHNSVILRSKYMSSNNNHAISVHKVIDFRKSNLESFCVGFQSRPWHVWYRSDAEIQEKADIFYAWIAEELDKLPSFYVEIQSNDKPWISPLIKHLILSK